MIFFPRDRYQQTLFILFLLFFIASCIAPPYVEFLLMQHAPDCRGGRVALGLHGPISFRHQPC